MMSLNDMKVSPHLLLMHIAVRNRGVCCMSQLRIESALHVAGIAMRAKTRML